MESQSKLESAFSKKKSHILLSLYRKKWLLVLFFGVAGFILPMLYGYANGFPIPHVHDEFSYLLASDTYAHGRLTNPTPVAWENFEAPHILVKPSYMSKYPPMQGLSLAAGQVLFGHPAFGIWISCGVAAAALFWMMLAWTRQRWAILGTLLMILLIGVNSYWAQSYWGGMAAAAGGALFFGGFRRIFKKLSVSSTTFMLLGGIILVNSRPFEGTVTMLPALFVLLIWLLRDGKNSFAHKFSKIILPGVLIAGIALSAMAYYNYRLTGNALRFAYTEHQSQYFSTPLFIFQSPAESYLQGHQRLQKLYNFLDGHAPITDFNSFGLPDYVYLYPFYAFAYLFFGIPYFLMSLPLMLFFIVVLFLIFSNKWLQLLFLTIVFTFGCMSIATYWDNYHYAASLTACFYLVLIEGFNKFILLGKKQKRLKLVYLLLTTLTVSSLFFQPIYMLDIHLPEVEVKSIEKNIKSEINLSKSVKISIPKRTTFIKPIVEEAIEKLPEKYLALVSYSNDYTIHDDIVFNKADIENSKLIWAYDLGEKRNKNLLDHYKNRKVLRVAISGSQMKVEPY